MCLAFPDANTWIGYEMNHMDLLSRPDVYEKIREWLGPGYQRHF